LLTNKNEETDIEFHQIKLRLISFPRPRSRAG